jgi:glycosyltransferase involved in cell wall biosynthesis
LLLIPHLGGGGAERVFALLARGLCKEKYELHLGIVTEANASTDGIPASVTIHRLGASRIRSAAFRLLGLIRRVRPNVILSGMFHLNFMVLLLRPLFPRSTRVLVRQNGIVSASLALDNLPAYSRLLYRRLYRFADRIVCQSDAMASDLAQELGIGTNRLIVLPNPVDVDAMCSVTGHAPVRWTGPGPHLLAVGRLSPEKGFDLLLHALAILRAQFPLADLAIAGAGPEEFRLRALCRDLGLESQVHLAGHIEQPSAWFAGSSAFVLSSRHEGMPNALLEAAAAGLPIVALPAAGGVADLLRGQPGVWLGAEISAAALAASVLEALQALEPGQRFTHAFIEPFRMERVIQRYEDLIDATIQACVPVRDRLFRKESHP